jgi:hypothetical protein
MKTAEKPTTEDIEATRYIERCGSAERILAHLQKEGGDDDEMIPALLLAASAMLGGPGYLTEAAEIYSHSFLEQGEWPPHRCHHLTPTPNH